ncbi:hypothetical protein BSKO_10358 [Bryopsis sp. KO-2023]|nr:hypothetical protein BSKO_10358 [Bryopsis sp. KO-2023]
MEVAVETKVECRHGDATDLRRGSFSIPLLGEGASLRLTAEAKEIASFTQKEKLTKVAKQEVDREAGIMSAYGVYQRKRFRLPPSLLSLSMDSLFGEDYLMIKEDASKKKDGDKRKRRCSDDDGGDDGKNIFRGCRLGSTPCIFKCFEEMDGRAGSPSASSHHSEGSQIHGECGENFGEHCDPVTSEYDEEASYEIAHLYFIPPWRGTEVAAQAKVGTGAGAEFEAKSASKPNSDKHKKPGADGGLINLME